MADYINAEPDQIIFTSGGTESDNAFTQPSEWTLTSEIEHPAILNCGSHLYVKPNQYGVICPPTLKNVLSGWNKPTNETKFFCNWATFMSVNNEVGTIQPIKELTEICHEYGMKVHTDAVQAVGHIPIDVKALNVDALSMSAHKFHGPKGVGVLYVKDPDAYKTFMHGGGQENGHRPGTENVFGAVALAEALKLSCEEMEEVNNRLRNFQTTLMALILQIPDAIITGSMSTKHRVVGNVSCAFKGINGQELVVLLDSYGICASAGSACHSGNPEPSHVLKAMGVDEEYINGSLRLTMSRFTTMEDVKALMRVLPEAVEILRNKGVYYERP